MKKILASFLGLVFLCSLISIPCVDYVHAENIVPYGCNDVWYEFQKLSEEKVYGEPIKASPDFDTSNVRDGVIHAQMKCTVTAYINASLDYTAKEFVKASISAAWRSSAEYQNTFDYYVGPNKTGYMVFIPYYTKISGYLKMYGACGEGLISTKYVETYIPRTVMGGLADGKYSVVYY